MNNDNNFKTLNYQLFIVNLSAESIVFIARGKCKFNALKNLNNQKKKIHQSFYLFN